MAGKVKAVARNFCCLCVCVCMYVITSSQIWWSSRGTHTCQGRSRAFNCFHVSARQCPRELLSHMSTLSVLSCQATGEQRHGRGRRGHLNRKKPRNQLPVRFVASRLRSSCSSHRGHDRICNSLPLFTLRRPGFTSRQCGVVAWLRLTSGKGLSPLIQAYSAGGEAGVGGWSCKTE